MAEALAKKILEETLGREDIKIVSAGTSAVDGSPAASNAVVALKQKGIDLAGHRSRQLSPQMIMEADLTLTMTQNQKKQVLSILPSAYGSVFTLREYVMDRGSGDDSSQELLELVGRLEEKEQEFYGRHGARIEALQTEYEELQKRMRDIESELMRLEEMFARETLPERQRIAELEGSSEVLDIADPFGQPLETYCQCASELQELIAKALEKFLQEVDE